MSQTREAVFKKKIPSPPVGRSEWRVFLLSLVMLMDIHLKFLQVLLIFYLLSVNHLFAQSFKGGLLGGLVASQVDGDNWAGYNKPGLELGGFVNIDLSKNHSLQTELKFIQKGSRKVPNFSKGDYSYYKLSLDYVEMPFLYRWTIKNKYIFESGLGIAYLAKAREDKDGYGWETPYPDFFSIEIPFYLGAHYKISDHFTANFRYSYSVLPIRSNPGNQTYYFNRGQYNNLISAVLYYTFK